MTSSRNIYVNDNFPLSYTEELAIWY